MNTLLLSVPTLFGLEGPAANEIRRLGYTTDRVEDGRVSFYGDARAICRANLWLRTAERVQIKVGDFTAVSFAALFDAARAIPWGEMLPADAAFPVKGHCLSSKLASVPDCQAIIKKAAVESMKDRWKQERFSESGALYGISFNIIRDRATIYIDTSGEGLHKRGYRESSTITPLRETLAAALVDISGWRPGLALWDPFCGSGTIAIEAAMMAACRAPGLARRFTAETWGAGGGLGSGDGAAPGHTIKKLWDEERSAARSAFENRIGELTSADAPAALAGSDISRRCVQAAAKNAANAGVSKLVRFFQLSARDMSPKHPALNENGVRFPPRGCIVTNPPYGERDGDLAGALESCREWAQALESFRAWGRCVISAIDGFEKETGRVADKRRKLYNGKIKCQAYLYRPETAAGGASANNTNRRGGANGR